MGIAAMMPSVVLAATATEGKYYDYNTKEWKTIPPQQNVSSGWELGAFTRRLALARAGSHCKGCGAPLVLDDQGGCEYCGLVPR